MINIYIVLIILFIHWFADFVLQTSKQAQGKSKNWNDLLSHTATYSMVWYGVMVILSIWGNHFNGPSIDDMGWSPLMILFPVITFICHTITDYFTSRLNTYLWNKKDIHNFFVSIGFDQFLHYIQLLLTYYLLTT